MSQSRYQSAQAAEDRVTQTVSDAANAAGAAVRDATSHFRDTASDIGARVSRRADGAVNDLADRVEEQPITALLIAGGVGLLAGLLLGRR
jgi:ElaB/YqjD/DUF883 family membrane-anchored ribosome-binding protein